MKLGRPRTLLSMILTGLGILTLPLLIGVGNAMLKLGQLTEESEVVVSAAATSTRASQRVVRALANMERNARQYVALDDPDLLPVYDEYLEALVVDLQTLTSVPSNDEILSAIVALQQATSSVREGPRGDVDPALLFTTLRQMSATANDVAEQMRELIDGQLAELQENTRSAQRSLLWQAGALIPGTLLLVLFFILLVGRPMRQVDRAIRELGKGDFGHEIAISGPSDLETLGRQLEWLRNQLQESTEEKNRFLRHMSHELKTPLANIREGADLLLDGSVGKLDRQQEEVTGILRENGIKLQQLIENLLTFSAWQTRTAALDLQTFELKPLVFAILSLHRLAIAKRRIKLQIQVEPVTINADEGKLRLVLENLISNALKFTPDRGTIYVNAALSDNILVIGVADSGPGILPEDRPRIFEAFFQGQRPQGGKVGGTGIGLSVVHECVQAHGGEVRVVEDSPYPGAHFEVRLPLRRATDQLPMAVNA